MPCCLLLLLRRAPCRSSYDYVMVTDDDLIMDACTIDMFFQVLRQLYCAVPPHRRTAPHCPPVLCDVC